MLSMSEKHSYTILENLWYQRQDNWICQFRLLHKVLSKRLRLYVDKVQIVQDLDLHNRLKRMDFAIDMLKRTEDNAEFLNHVMLFYETCFPLCSIVNCHNVYMGIWKFSWICEIQRYSPKVNAWYGLMYNCIIGPFFSLKRHTCHLLRHIGKFHISTTQSFSFMTFLNKMVHHLIGVPSFIVLWMTISQDGGLDEGAQFFGHPDHMILCHWTFSFEDL